MWPYIMAFVLCGLAGVLTLLASNKSGEKASAEQIDAFKEIASTQTRELIGAMRQVSGVSQQINRLAEAIQGGDISNETIQKLRQEAGELSDVAARWADQAERRVELTRAELDVESLSAIARASSYNQQIRPYYAYVVESLEAYATALGELGYKTEVIHHNDLPTSLFEVREPVNRGDATYMLEVRFESNRRWTLIYQSGGVSETEARMPTLYLARAQDLDPRNHGPNYFEFLVQDRPEVGLRFSIRSNFESVRKIAGIEGGELGSLQDHIDTTFQKLLERERVQD